jgi:hypothetical protein
VVKSPICQRCNVRFALSAMRGRIPGWNSSPHTALRNPGEVACEVVSLVSVALSGGTRSKAFVHLQSVRLRHLSCGLCHPISVFRGAPGDHLKISRQRVRNSHMYPSGSMRWRVWVTRCCDVAHSRSAASSARIHERRSRQHFAHLDHTRSVAINCLASQHDFDIGRAEHCLTARLRPLT